ncbi:MAG TPA: hypothetical protein VK932_11720, partial [Kofleriaceae bacterium]|nr:hypothetical protein [Kofleriaceae bacterium]
QAWTDDRTRWSGVALSACVRIGGACLGGRVGHARQEVALDLTAAAKRELSLLATVSYSHDVGRMSIAPEVGVGLGRLSTARIEGCKMDVNCDPMDPSCSAGMEPQPACTTEPGQVYVGDDLDETTYAPRIATALRIAIPLFDHVWLDGLVAATIAPLGHHEDYGTDPASTTMPNTASLGLPGDPLLGLQLGVGIRFGAR